MGSLVPKVDCLWSPRAILGEGPIFDPRRDRVLWVDIKGRRLFSCDASGGSQMSWGLQQRLCSIDVPPADWTPPPHLRGDLYVGCADAGFGWLSVSPDKATFEPIAHPEAALKSNRFNDGKTGPDGRYWAGTMDDTEKAASGSLYAFGRDGRWSVIDSGYKITNGPAFSPDGRTVYHTDSALQRIYALSLDPQGTVRDRRVLKQFEPGDGYPDGMTTDSAGNLWVAMWGGGRMETLSATGARLGTVAIPTAQPTSCIFSKAEPNILFVTSAAIGLDETDALAGSLFRVQL